MHSDPGSSLRLRAPGKGAVGPSAIDHPRLCRSGPSEAKQGLHFGCGASIAKSYEEGLAEGNCSRIWACEARYTKLGSHTLVTLTVSAECRTGHSLVQGGNSLAECFFCASRSRVSKQRQCVPCRRVQCLQAPYLDAQAMRLSDVKVLGTGREQLFRFVIVYGVMMPLE